jgi:hypothetical protein
MHPPRLPSPLPRRRAALALLAVAALVSAAADARAGDADSGDSASATPSLLDRHGWRFVPLSQMLEHSQRERFTSRGMPRLLPLAMLPLQQSALWLGVSSTRPDGERDRSPRIELRWSIPLERLGN